MKRNTILFLLLCIGASTRPIGAFDRAAIHEARLVGLDLSQRALMATGTESLVALSASFEDNLVSYSAAPARFTQGNVCLLGLNGSGWLTVWEDNRSGAQKIFMQHFGSQIERMGGNQMIVGSSLGADFVEPKLAVDLTGRIYLFYRDKTRGLIFGSRYLSDFTPDLQEFLVNDTSAGAFAGPFDFDIFPDGRMFVVWENVDATGPNIHLRIFDPEGDGLAGPSVVNSDLTNAQRWVPSVAVEPGTGFLVAWEDYRLGNADIYARLFAGNGSPIGDDFAVVPSGAAAALQFGPEVVFSENNKYLIGWVDQREGQEIFIQQWNPATGRVGDNRRISLGDALISNRDLDLTVSPDSRLLATWAAFGIDNSVLAVRFDSTLTAVDMPSKHNLSSIGSRWAPSADFDGVEQYGLAWTEFQNEDADLHFMVFDTSGARSFVPEIQLNTDSVGAPSHDPRVVPATDWYDLIVWVDERNDAGDIYLDAISNAGNSAQGNVRINQDIGPSLQTEPAVAVSDDKSLVAWIDSRPLGGIAGQRIFGRFGSLFGVFADEEFLISDTDQASIKGSPVVALTSLGQGLIAWIDHRELPAQVWGRWLNPAGAIDGVEFRISDQANDLNNADLHLHHDALDRFCAVWLDKDSSEPTVKGKWFNSNKSEEGAFVWSSTITDVSIDEIAVDISESGEIIILWSGVGPGSRHVYLTRLAPDGTVLTAPLQLTDDLKAGATNPSVSISHNGYVSAAWVDRRDGLRRVYYQVLDNTLTPIETNLPVSSIVPEYMATPSTAANRGRAWFTWADPRENGLNIYAASIVYLPTDVNDNINETLPRKYHLAQNYPNPFNPATWIEFSLPYGTELTITVYNLLGRHVTTLAEGNFPAGDHRVTWDGTDRSGNRVASGIYFYQVDSPNFVDRRKMLLLK